MDERDWARTRETRLGSGGTARQKAAMPWAHLRWFWAFCGTPDATTCHQTPLACPEDVVSPCHPASLSVPIEKGRKQR